MKNIKSTFLKYLLFSLLITLLSCSKLEHKTVVIDRGPAQVFPIGLNADCTKLLNTIGKRSKLKLTNIEKELIQIDMVDNPDILLTKLINKLANIKPDLAKQVVKARRLKESFGSSKIELDLTNLEGKMSNFLNGPYRKIIGSRGLSEPFMSIKKIGMDTLVIKHMEDKYPLMVKWSSDVAEPSHVVEELRGSKTYRVLYLPASMTSKNDYKLLKNKYIYQLINASRLHKYISSRHSLIMSISSLLHEGQLIFNRKTQGEYFEFRDKLDSDSELRTRVKSMLFLGSTGVGKTKIITDTIDRKIVQMNKIFNKQNHHKKLSVVMANSPSLVNHLAKNIGGDLYREHGQGKFRLIQWGGKDTEKMSYQELLKFIEESDVPVILVTSGNVLIRRMETADNLTKLFRYTNSVIIDEAHNSETKSFKGLMDSAMKVAEDDRKSDDIMTSLDILGLTASPINRNRRTSDLFDFTFWGSIDTAGKLSIKIKKYATQMIEDKGHDVLEWIRMRKQYNNAIDRGEITAPDEPIYFNPHDYGHSFDTVFKRASKGTHSNVNIENLKKVWPDIEKMIVDHGPGIIHTYQRDANDIAAALSELSGKNYVSLKRVTPNQKVLLYKAFVDQTPYLLNGESEPRIIDAIVGKIEEGHDFPDAGWYLNFKKYVKFPESLQGQGRIVRIALDKLTPIIIYFGEEIDSIAFKDVRDLILRKMGKLRRKIAKGNKFINSRKPSKTHPDSIIGHMMGDFNAQMEAFFRINSGLTADFGKDKAIDKEIIVELRKRLLKMRKSGSNKEIADGFKDLLAQIHSFAFLKKDLKQTWKFCDKMLKGEKDLTTRFTSDELYILSQKHQMEMIQEFRLMKNWMGSVPRSIMEEISLEHINSSEVARSVSAFVERNNLIPYEFDNISRSNSLKKVLDETLENYPETFWTKLSYRGKVLIDGLLKGNKNVLFEDALDDFVAKNERLPVYSFEKIDDSLRNIDSSIEHKLVEKLRAYMGDGRLQLNFLNESTLKTLDSSELLHKEMIRMTASLDDLLASLKRELGSFEYKKIAKSELNLSKLSEMESFRILRTISDLSDKKLPLSSEYIKMIKALIKSHLE